jgi:predicted nucleotidyltransferase
VRLEKLKSKLNDAAKLASGRACVYAIGSFGRGEASEHSDLDLFILGNTKKNEKGEEQRLLSKLDEIRVKADLIEVTSEMGVPQFSGDGKYLSHYSVSELLDTLRKPEDDVTNTFTARLLLLLESCPLIGDEIYDRAVDEVIRSRFSPSRAALQSAFLTRMG